MGEFLALYARPDAGITPLAGGVRGQGGGQQQVRLRNAARCAWARSAATQLAPARCARAPRSSMPALRKRGQRRGMPRRWPLCLPDTLWEVRLALARRALLHFAGWAGRARDERAAECQTDPRLRPISGVLPPPTLTRCASSTPLCLVSLSARRWASAARMAWCSACRRRC